MTKDVRRDREQPEGGRMVGRSTKDADEELATKVIQLALGVPVIQHDDRAGTSEYDLKILYPRGRTGAAEVVSTRDTDRMSLARAAGKRGYARCSELTRLWIVSAFPGTNIRENAKRIRALLVQLEHAKATRLSRADPHPLTTIMLDLGIGSCWSSEPTPKHPPGFYVTPDAFAAWVGDGERARKFCEGFLADEKRADVLSKLRRAETDERHAVIILTIDALGPFTAIDGGALPISAPVLPSEVEWLWVVASHSLPARAIFWCLGGPWSEVVMTEEAWSATVRDTMRAAD
jgi:hypothetical protein